MSRWPRRRDRSEDGFTLIELVITVGIIGIIVVPLTGVVLSYLRNTVDTEVRLTESHDVQFASAYWQRDVASIGVRSSTYDPDPSKHSYPMQQSIGLPPCETPAGATSLVTLSWSDYTSLTPSAPSSTVTITYATRPVGAVYELLRVRCVDGNKQSEQSLADSLVAVPSVVCVQPGGGSSCTAGGTQVPAVVKLRLRIHDSSGHDTNVLTATLSGERRQT